MWLFGLVSYHVVSNFQVSRGSVELNGLWRPFGIETRNVCAAALRAFRRNGLWRPFGIETIAGIGCDTRRNTGLNGQGSPFGMETTSCQPGWFALQGLNGQGSPVGMETITSR
jgi:hypothetical protein